MRDAFRNRAPLQRPVARTLEFESAIYEDERKLMADGEARKDDPSQLYHSTILGPEFVHALKDLPEEYRSTLLLVDIEDLTCEEAAKV